MQSFFWTSMIVRACSSSRVSFVFSPCSAARRFCSWVSFAFLPRVRPRAASAPVSRSRRQVLRCELYSPSRRSSAPIAPKSFARSASSSTASLYAAVNWRRLATARTSGSDTPAAAAAAAVERALASPARTRSTAAIDDTIFSFFLLDIGHLPFDSNSTRVGVSRHIGTNGGLGVNFLEI